MTGSRKWNVQKRISLQVQCARLCKCPPHFLRREFHTVLQETDGEQYVRISARACMPTITMLRIIDDHDVRLSLWWLACCAYGCVKMNALSSVGACTSWRFRLISTATVCQFCFNAVVVLRAPAWHV